jgi:hypothetical protein
MRTAGSGLGSDAVIAPLGVGGMGGSSRAYSRKANVAITLPALTITYCFPSIE